MNKHQQKQTKKKNTFCDLMIHAGRFLGPNLKIELLPEFRGTCS